MLQISHRFFLKFFLNFEPKKFESLLEEDNNKCLNLFFHLWKILNYVRHFPEEKRKIQLFCYFLWWLNCEILINFHTFWWCILHLSSLTFDLIFQIINILHHWWYKLFLFFLINCNRFSSWLIFHCNSNPDWLFLIQDKEKKNKGNVFLIIHFIIVILIMTTIFGMSRAKGRTTMIYNSSLMDGKPASGRENLYVDGDWRIMGIYYRYTKDI